MLSGFGEIEYYKNLKYDELTAPNTALVIFKEDGAAIEALKRSPIRFRMGRAVVAPQARTEEKAEGKGGAKEEVMEAERENRTLRGPRGTPFGLGSGGKRGMATSAVQRVEGFRPFFSGSEAEPPPPQFNSQPSRPAKPSPPAPAAAPEDPNARIFQIQTNPSRRHFRDHVNVAQYHGSFALDTEMFGQQDMVKRVPLPGLSCMDFRAAGVEGRPWEIVRRERAKDHEGVMKRRLLGELWEEGRAVDEEEGVGKGEAQAKTGAGDVAEDDGDVARYDPGRYFREGR